MFVTADNLNKLNFPLLPPGEFRFTINRVLKLGIPPVDNNNYVIIVLYGEFLIGAANKYIQIITHGLYIGGTV